MLAWTELPAAQTSEYEASLDSREIIEYEAPRTSRSGFESAVTLGRRVELQELGHGGVRLDHWVGNGVNAQFYRG